MNSLGEKAVMLGVATTPAWTGVITDINLIASTAAAIFAAIYGASKAIDTIYKWLEHWKLRLSERRKDSDRTRKTDRE